MLDWPWLKLKPCEQLYQGNVSLAFTSKTKNKQELLEATQLAKCSFIHE
jgi:hypothetical protein